MTAAEITNWLAIYAATGACCTIALVLSVCTVAAEIYRERAWTWITGFQTLAQFVPKIWWRWQQRYLLSTPVTLTIVSWFAATLNWI